MPRLRTEDANVAPFPLPPLAEQHRIVAKVDELMALCDRLEAAQNKREQRRDRLVAASLNRISQIALSAEGEAALREHARFHLTHFPRLASRPEHIKTLRQTILSLAVRGRLVPQDPNDEAGSTVLKRIQAERAVLSAGKKPSKSNSLAHTNSELLSSNLPESWQWAPTDSLCETIVDCPHSTPVFVPSGAVCLDTNAFKEGVILQHKVRYVSEECYLDRVKRVVPQSGDIIFAREGSVGESVIVPDGMRCCLGQRVMLFRPMAAILSRYFRLALSEPAFLKRLLALHKGIGAKHVNVADMRNAALPLPPLAEQHRIVAKVDELMAVCDQLEANLTATQTDSRRLLEAVLRDALAPALEAAACRIQ